MWHFIGRILYGALTTLTLFGYSLIFKFVKTNILNSSVDTINSNTPMENFISYIFILILGAVFLYNIGRFRISLMKVFDFTNWTPAGTGLLPEKKGYYIVTENHNGTLTTKINYYDGAIWTGTFIRHYDWFNNRIEDDEISAQFQGYLEQGKSNGLLKAWAKLPDPCSWFEIQNPELF